MRLRFQNSKVCGSRLARLARCGMEDSVGVQAVRVLDIGLGDVQGLAVVGLEYSAVSAGVVAAGSVKTSVMGVPLDQGRVRCRRGAASEGRESIAPLRAYREAPNHAAQAGGCPRRFHHISMTLIVVRFRIFRVCLNLSLRPAPPPERRPERLPRAAGCLCPMQFQRVTAQDAVGRAAGRRAEHLRVLVGRDRPDGHMGQVRFGKNRPRKAFPACLAPVADMVDAVQRRLDDLRRSLPLSLPCTSASQTDPRQSAVPASFSQD